MRLFSWWMAACGLLLGCGEATTPQSTGSTSLIIISDLRYIPQNLTVPPGATVIVENEDAIPHSVTSEAAPGSFTPGEVAGISFDTGAFTNAMSAFQIPATAADGTVVPFYCTVHKGTMTTPEGTITIRAAP